MTHVLINVLTWVFDDCTALIFTSILLIVLLWLSVEELLSSFLFSLISTSSDCFLYPQSAIPRIRQGWFLCFTPANAVEENHDLFKGDTFGVNECSESVSLIVPALLSFSLIDGSSIGGLAVFDFFGNIGLFNLVDLVDFGTLGRAPCFMYCATGLTSGLALALVRCAYNTVFQLWRSFIGFGPYWSSSTSWFGW